VCAGVQAATARLEASVGQKADAAEMRAELDQRPLVADINAALAEKVCACLSLSLSWPSQPAYECVLCESCAISRLPR